MTSAGRPPLQLEEVDLVEVVRDVSARLERKLDAAGSELRLELPPHCRGVWDRRRVEQIFTRVLVNAIRFGARQPIDVTIAGDDEEVELSVKDHGVGMGPEGQQRVFLPVEPADGATDHLGDEVWTLQQSALSMGGHVRVESEPGRGYELIVSLPRATEADLT
jgi:signal transduction histidine kinase